MSRLLALLLAPLFLGGILAVASVILSSRISQREEASPYWIQRNGVGQRVVNRLREGGLL